MDTRNNEYLPIMSFLYSYERKDDKREEIWLRNVSTH